MTKTAKRYHHGSLREALISEAASMIADKGVDSVTMREIGRRLDVSRAAPYRHFSDKESLLVAVAATGFRELGARLAAVDGPTAGDGVEHIRRMGDAYVHFALTNRAHYRLMYGREALARENEPALREAANALFDQLAAALEACQREGNIKAGDPRAQAYTAWGAVHGLASLLIDGQILADVDVDALIELTLDTLVAGLSA